MKPDLTRFELELCILEHFPDTVFEHHTEEPAYENPNQLELPFEPHWLHAPEWE